MSSSGRWDSFGGGEADFSPLSPQEREAAKKNFETAILHFVGKLLIHKKSGYNVEGPLSVPFAEARAAGKKLSREARDEILKKIRAENPGLPLDEI